MVCRRLLESLLFRLVLASLEHSFESKPAFVPNGSARTKKNEMTEHCENQKTFGRSFGLVKFKDLLTLDKGMCKCDWWSMDFKMDVMEPLFQEKEVYTFYSPIRSTCQNSWPRYPVFMGGTSHELIFLAREPTKKKWPPTDGSHLQPTPSHHHLGQRFLIEKRWRHTPKLQLRQKNPSLSVPRY